MLCRQLYKLFYWALAAFAMLCTMPAHATNIAISCHLSTADDVTIRKVEELTQGANCHDSGEATKGPIVWLRYNAERWQDTGPPQSLIAPITKMGTITAYAQDRDGTLRSQVMSLDDGTALAGGSVFTLPLPPVTDQTKAVFLRLERPWNNAVMGNTTLSTEPGGENWPIQKLVFYAILFGIFCAPLLFDIATYWALRHPLSLWHGGMVLAGQSNVLLFSGLFAMFVNVPVVYLAKGNGLTIALAGAMAAMFASNLIERKALDRRLRRGLVYAGLTALIIPGVITLHPPFLNYTAHQLFYIGFIPLVIIMPVALIQALLRGSRSAKYLIVSWIPILLSCVERIIRGLGFYEAPAFLDELFYFSLAGEVIVSAIGMADFFLTLRVQRDKALSRARTQENLAGRDPLTGLMNRRAIEPRFAELSAEGFTTFALLDLDRFKSINDQHGHSVGDDVLRAAAKALNPDEDTLVMRLGGEEFLMLLRGRNARQRAEHRRQALPIQISRSVPGLERPVTASMGMVEGAMETMASTSFSEIYERADKLLYEAKQAGRNRTLSEKHTLFSPPKRESRTQPGSQRPAA